MILDEHKIIGYFSFFPTTSTILCDGDACIIAETEQLIKLYEKNMMPDEISSTIRKTKFSEITRGLELGGAYAFDKGAYARFFPLAQQYGFEDLVEPEEFFSQQSTSGMHFIQVQLIIR